MVVESRSEVEMKGEGWGDWGDGDVDDCVDCVDDGVVVDTIDNDTNSSFDVIPGREIDGRGDSTYCSNKCVIATLPTHPQDSLPHIVADTSEEDM